MATQIMTNQIVQRARGAARLFQFPAEEGVSEKAKLLWLVRLRWMAIALFFALCAPALIFGMLKRDTVAFYLGIIAVLLAFNLISQLVIAGSKFPIGPVAICFQLAFDLFALTGLLAIVGGYGNPFVMLYLLNAGLGGVLIQGRLSWPFLLLTHALLGLLQLRYVFASPGTVSEGLTATFIAYHLLVFAFWLVMRSLGSYLESQSERQRRAQVDLEKRDRLRSIGALAAGFSHEFASPLNAAKIRVERLKRIHGESEDAAEALSALLICQNVIQRMNSSQMDSRDFQFKTVAVGELLNDIVESWREDRPTAKLSLNIERGIRSSIPPVNFAQVLINLLDNAFDAGAEIEVNLTQNKNEIRLSVEDRGPGFPAEVLSHKGEPFLTTKKDGTGLGLYVSELFVQSLGGNLEIGNRSGGGARVAMHWPVKDQS